MDPFSPEQLEGYYNTAANSVLAFAPKLLLAIAVLIVGWWLIRRLVKMLDAALRRSSADAILTRFLTSLASIVLKAVLLISTASMVGIATTSFVAMLGAAGLAIGLALQGSLANFAGGVLLLLFRPFKVGDFIEAQGVSGTVFEMQIFNTILRTPDNRRVIIPNGPLANNNVTNYSAEPTRRVDLVFGVGYDDDLKQAKEILQSLLAADERVLQAPEPLVAISELGDSAINITVRAWVNAADYWPMRFAYIEAAKLAFDQAGISIPYPQTDVHLHPSEVAA